MVQCWREVGGGAPNENLRCGALYSLGGVSSLPVAERGVVGSDVLEPAAPSAPSPAALPASPCTAWIESDWKPWPPELGVGLG